MFIYKDVHAGWFIRSISEFFVTTCDIVEEHFSPAAVAHDSSKQTGVKYTYIRISHNHIAHAGVNLTWGAYIV